MLAPTVPAKPPLCKGRWHGVSRDGGIGTCAGALGCIRKATIPQSALSRSQLPLHKGASLYTHYFGPGGVNRREVKKREEKRSTPAFFSFFTSRPPLWGSQGAGPLGRGSLPRNSETFFASFFGHKKGRTPGRMTLIRAERRKVARSGSRPLKFKNYKTVHFWGTNRSSKSRVANSSLMPLM